MVLRTLIKYTEPRFRVRKYKYANKLTEAPFVFDLKKTTKSIKLLRELHLSNYDSSKFQLARSLLSNHTKTLRRNIINNPKYVSGINRKMIDLDKYIPQLRSYSLTLFDSLSMRRLFYFHNLETLTINPENAALVHASGMDLKNEWFYIEPAMYKLKRHLKGLFRLKQIVVCGSFNMISQKIIEIINQCMAHLTSLSGFTLSLTSRDTKDSQKKKNPNCSVYKYLTKLDLQEMQNMRMTCMFLQHSSELQSLRSLSIDCPYFRDNDSAVLKNISKLIHLIVLNLHFSMASKKDWKGLLESISLPTSLKAVSFAIYGGISMDQLTGGIGKGWETNNPCDKNATCQKFFAQWEKLKELKEIEIKIEWTKFKSWYLSFIIGWLKRLKNFESLVLQIECPEFDEIFYEKISSLKDNQGLNLTYFYNTLEKALNNLDRMVIHAPFVLFNDFAAEKNLGHLKMVEIMGKIKGEGIENFLKSAQAIESLELNWVSFKNEELLSLVAAEVLKLEKISTLKVVFEANKIKNEKLVDKMMYIAKRSKASVINLESLEGNFTIKQLEEIGKYFLDTNSKKRVSIQTKTDTFSYYPEYKSFGYNIAGKYGKDAY